MIYKGRRESEIGGQPVVVETDDEQYPLPPRNDLQNHSPDGFQWGYGGSGPAQLALAILAHAKDDETALEHYQDFKWDIIAPMNGDWAISEELIDDWLDSQHD